MMSTTQERAMNKAIQAADDMKRALGDAGLLESTPHVNKGTYLDEEAHHHQPLSSKG